MTTLEEVFLTIEEEDQPKSRTAPDMAKINRANTTMIIPMVQAINKGPSATPNPGNPDDDKKTEKEATDVIKMDNNEPFHSADSVSHTTTPPVDTSERSSCRTFGQLTRLRFLLKFRSPFTILEMILMPIFLILATCYLLHIDSPAARRRDNEFDELYDGPAHNDLLLLDSNVYINNWPYGDLYGVQEDLDNEMDLGEYLNSYQSIPGNAEFGPRDFVGTFRRSENDPNIITIDYNVNAVHSLPVLINVFSNFLAARSQKGVITTSTQSFFNDGKSPEENPLFAMVNEFSNNPDAGEEVMDSDEYDQYYEQFTNTMKQDNSRDRQKRRRNRFRHNPLSPVKAAILNFAPILIGNAILYVPLTLAVDLILERQKNLKNRMRINGVGFMVYYGSFICVHAVFMLIVGILLYLIVLACGLEALLKPGAVFHMCFYYLFSIIPLLLFVACLSFMFSSVAHYQWICLLAQ